MAEKRAAPDEPEPLHNGPEGLALPADLAPFKTSISAEAHILLLLQEPIFLKIARHCLVGTRLPENIAGSSEDLLQDYAYRIAKSGAEVQADAVRAHAWVALSRLAIDKTRRSEARFRHPAQLTEVPEPSAAIEESMDDARMLDAALATLRPRDREIMRLRYFADLTQEQTAQRLGIPLGTVKSSSARAIRLLQNYLAGHMEPEGG